MGEPTFKPGDRVICIRAGSKASANVPRLERGATYTVIASHRTAWLDGVNLAEAPLPTGRPLYSASRFQPTHEGGEP